MNPPGQQFMVRVQQLTYIVLCVAGRDRSPGLNYQDTDDARA